ncbi:MAG: glycosyltransferase family 2 protein [Nibricoccus sp.]
MISPQVDIVIPAYNEAKYIGECLESLIRQTYTHWRAVVVDNCSNDGTAKIADSYAARDERIQVRHCTEFLDQCGNYNRAVAQASHDADYVKVLEADNWLLDDAIENMVALGEKDPEIGLIGSYWFRGVRVDGSGLGPEREIIPGREAIRMFFLNRVYIFGTPSTLLFRAQALREEKVWFKPGIFYDDVELCVRVLSKWKLGFVHQVLSYVRDDNGGFFSKVRLMDHEPAFRYFLFREHGASFFDAKTLCPHLELSRKQYRERLAYSVFIARRDSQYLNFHRALFRVNGLVLRRRDLLGPLLAVLAKPLAIGYRRLSCLILKKPYREGDEATYDPPAASRPSADLVRNTA